MRLTRGSRLAATLVALALPAVAHAQGFGLNEIGTCALSRGFAATSRPCDDGSAIYWNPAALTRLSGTVAYLGAAAIQVTGDFTHDFTGRVDEGDVPLEVPPHLFLSRAMTLGGRRAAIGLGVYVPYGLTSQWQQTFPGRFSAQKASLATIYVQPNLSYELVPGRLSIGGGPVFGHSTVELRQSADLSTVRVNPQATFGQLGIPAGTEFARAHLEGSANGWGFNLGLYARVAERLHFGARYLHRIDFEYEGAEATFTQVLTNLSLPVGNPIAQGQPVPLDPILQAQFTGSGALTPQEGSTKIPHPSQFQAGLTWDGLRSGNTSLALEGTWIGWKAFEELPVEFSGQATDRVLIEDYEDSWSIRTGLENRYVGRWQGWSSRLGFSYVKSPAPDETVTPLLPDMDRWNYNVGVGIPLGRSYALDLGYLTVQTEGRRGRIHERASRSQTAEQLNTGAYSLGANIFSLSLRAQF
ncbi:MAG TPA: outer membrane protein transport protein [Gemmatimonadaceae bacterium]|nr:outer membrane protein transport protein [Gemmatimonadaceae bacterium]